MLVMLVHVVLYSRRWRDRTCWKLTERLQSDHSTCWCVCPSEFMVMTSNLLLRYSVWTEQRLVLVIWWLGGWWCSSRVSGVVIKRLWISLLFWSLSSIYYICQHCVTNVFCDFFYTVKPPWYIIFITIISNDIKSFDSIKWYYHFITWYIIRLTWA